MSDLVKMQRHGLTVEVPPQDVSNYKRSGFKVVKDKPAPADKNKSEKAEKPEKVDKQPS